MVIEERAIFTEDDLKDSALAVRFMDGVECRVEGSSDKFKLASPHIQGPTLRGSIKSRYVVDHIV